MNRYIKYLCIALLAGYFLSGDVAVGFPTDWCGKHSIGCPKDSSGTPSIGSGQPGGPGNCSSEGQKTDGKGNPTGPCACLQSVAGTDALGNTTCIPCENGHPKPGKTDANGNCPPNTGYPCYDAHGDKVMVKDPNTGQQVWKCAPKTTGNKVQK
jgi:hypothetical protein